MEKEKNTQPHVTKNYHFEHVGQYIDYIHTQYVTIDKDAGIQIGEVNNQQPAPQPAPASLDHSTLIFLPNEQNRAAVETLLREALSISTKKSVICRKLYQQRELFNLHTQDDTNKANIINEWVKKFGLESNFKTLFTRKDFGNYYCKE